MVKYSRSVTKGLWLEFSSYHYQVVKSGRLERAQKLQSARDEEEFMTRLTVLTPIGSKVRERFKNGEHYHEKRHFWWALFFKDRENYRGVGSMVFKRDQGGLFESQFIRITKRKEIWRTSRRNRHCSSSGNDSERRSWNRFLFAIDPHQHVGNVSDFYAKWVTDSKNFPDAVIKGA